MHRLALLVFLTVAVATNAWAEGAIQAQLAEGERGTAVEIVDGDTLILDNGIEVRLVGLQAPKLPLGRSGFIAWPLGDESAAALTQLTRGRELQLAYGGARRDRYGRALAHLFDAKGRWVQGEMLRAGMARVYSFPDNRALVPEMLALEREARTARRGIWGVEFYRLRTPEELLREIDSFQLVEGRVLKAAKVKRMVYLNFGENWRDDFTLRLRGRVLKAFRRAGIDLLELSGRRVRARGWIKPINGPLIDLTHPEQLELLED